MKSFIKKNWILTLLVLAVVGYFVKTKYLPSDRERIIAAYLGGKTPETPSESQIQIWLQRFAEYRSEGKSEAQIQSILQQSRQV